MTKTDRQHGNLQRLTEKYFRKPNDFLTVNPKCWVVPLNM